MLLSTVRYPVLKVDATGDRVVSHAGSVLLTSTADVVGLGAALSAALGPWRKRHPVHDPGKMMLDLRQVTATGTRTGAFVGQIKDQLVHFGLTSRDR